MNDALHSAMEAEIGRHLQAIYRAVLEEPVPDRFIKLLADLEHREGKKQG
ncbi:MAG: NepR family anti-sigma factor [Acetobacteraceae bacterium]